MAVDSVTMSKTDAIQPNPTPTPSAVEAQLKPIADVLEHFDIEHIPVEDDPRQWSSLRKVPRSFAQPGWRRLIMTPELYASHGCLCCHGGRSGG